MSTSGRSRIVDRILQQETLRESQPESVTDAPPATEAPAPAPAAEPTPPAEPAPPAAEPAAAPPAPTPEPATPAPTAPPAADGPVTPPIPSPAAALEAEDEEDEEDMGALMDAMSIRKGEILKGNVAQIDEDGIRIDIGTKSEGLIPREELNADFASEFKIGQPIDVYVLKVETEDGYPLLSKSRADYHQLWNELEENVNTGKVMTVMVKDRVKGGLIVDVGVDGFVPASHTTTDTSRRPGNLDKFVGRTLRVRVLECDRKRNRVVLSHRLVVEEERQSRRAETLKQIETGKAMTGVVRRITDFGAFVDLGGIDGLLHISEMSWTRIGHPSEVVQKGEKIQVVVLKFDPERNRISLGMRQLLTDPWKGAAKKYRVGATVKATVTRLIRNGAFARLESGIEGIIPVSEMAQRRIGAPEEVVQVGQEVECRVLQVREKQRRISLSLKEAEQARERQEYRSYMKSQNSGGGVTLGDALGDVFNKLRDEVKPGEEQSAAPAPTEKPAPEPAPEATPEPEVTPAETSSEPAAEPAAKAAPEPEADEAPETGQTVEPTAEAEPTEPAAETESQPAETPELETEPAPVEPEAAEVEAAKPEVAGPEATEPEAAEPEVAEPEAETQPEA